MKKSVLVTGANGFVGSHLCEVLSHGYDVVRLNHGNSVSHNEDGSWQADICSKEAMHKLLKTTKPDYIVHLAAKTRNWFSDPEACFSINSLGTLNLYEQVLKVADEIEFNPKILYISSSEVYGKTTNPHDINEEAILRPVNFYAASKASAEVISYSYANTKNLNIIVARPFTHTGPGQSEGFFVPDMVSQIVKIEKTSGKGVIKVGNLSAIRDYSDVRDIVTAYMKLLEAPTNIGEIYNVCRGVGIAVSEILEKLTHFSTAKLKVEVDPTRFRPVDIPVFVGNNNKIKQQIDWIASIPLEKTLEETLKFHRKAQVIS
jgi:GDP-4-dehydro-6-deoxy-D-mannose reductase